MLKYIGSGISGNIFSKIFQTLITNIREDNEELPIVAAGELNILLPFAAHLENAS
jgi:hypothetical protein